MRRQPGSTAAGSRPGRSPSRCRSSRSRPTTPTTWRSRASSAADADRAAEEAGVPFAAALERVQAAIDAAASRAGREPDSVRLVAITKQVAPERVALAVAAGCRELGENRVQEAAAKILLVPRARWHLVGPLQSNKARRAIELFDEIESLDSLDLAARLDRLSGELRPARPLPVLLQVNVDADPAKSGFSAADLERGLDAILALPSLRVDGLMTVGRLVPDAEAARPTFRTLRELAERLRQSHPGLGAELSMGMSDDFEVAVEEGATIVRIGRALFGERPAHE